MSSATPEIVATAAEIAQASCYWKPEHFVGMLKEIAWPLVVLLIGLRYRAAASERFRGVFEKLKLGKLTLGTNGVTTEWQSSNEQTSPISNGKPEVYGEYKSFAQVTSYHELNDSEYIQTSVAHINKQLDSFELPLEERLDTLVKAFATSNAMQSYAWVSNSIFKSQLDLLTKLADTPPPHLFAYQHLESYFYALKAIHAEQYEKWDTQSYLKFLIDSGLLQVKGESYTLTTFGKSYLEYIQRNENITHSFRKV